MMTGLIALAATVTCLSVCMATLEVMNARRARRYQRHFMATFAGVVPPPTYGWRDLWSLRPLTPRRWASSARGHRHRAPLRMTTNGSRGDWGWLVAAPAISQGMDEEADGWVAFDDDGDTDYGVNPASGLPMLDACVDVAGNPIGSDGSDWSDWPLSGASGHAWPDDSSFGQDLGGCHA